MLHTMWPFNEADIYFNGVQLSAAENIFLDQPQSTETELRGMFLRNAFDITELVNKRDGASNSLAILVNPPNPAGTPGDNGGNSGDPNIGEMLRLSNKRYRDEVRLHAEMNLNFIRVWGGGIAERPEFYDACDEYGILVMQDFWISGEYSDPSSEGYTQIFLNCAKDTIRMLRNHASLCFWTGANETDPPNDISGALRCYIEGAVPAGGCAGFELLDGTRIYIPRCYEILSRSN